MRHATAQIKFNGPSPTPTLQITQEAPTVSGDSKDPPKTGFTKSPLNAIEGSLH
jgi:hypothetical protein